MDSTFIGQKRRYHIESKMGETPFGTVYRAFARRRVGRRILRRYYAIVECKPLVETRLSLNTALNQLQLRDESAMHVEEDLLCEGRRHVVFASGAATRGKGNRANALLNHGYLMLILATIILILMIVRFYQQ